MVKLKIDNYEVEATAGTSILEAARSVHIEIPTLCKHPDVDATAGCGICIVKVNGRIMRSCSTPIAEGMEVITSDAELVDVRRTVLKLILSNHPNACLTCIRSGHCELQDLTNTFGIKDATLPNLTKRWPIDDSTKALVLEFEQMHPLRPLRRSLPESAKRLGAGLPKPRPGHPDHRCQRHQPGRQPLHQMRPVFGSLPDRRHR